MTAVNGFYRYGVRHKLINGDVMSLLFEVTDEPASRVRLRHALVRTSTRALSFTDPHAHSLTIMIRP